MDKRLFAGLGLALCLSSGITHAEEENEYNRPIHLEASDDVLYHHKLSLGYLFVRPQGVAHGVDVTIPNAALPSLQSFNAADVDARVANFGTPGLFYSYAINDHWGVQLFGGIPPEIKLMGQGVINAPVTVLKLPPLPIVGNLPGFGGQLQAGGLTELLDAGAPANNPIATGKAWTPTAITTYTFFDRNALIRPFVGVGFTYGFLTNVKVNPNVTDALNQKAALLVLLTGDADAQKVTVKGEADPFFSAVGTLGVNVNFTKQLGLEASASYVPSATKVRIKIYDQKDVQIGETSTTIPINPYIFFVALTYRFNL